jgi:Tol biopolymer transport system component
MRVSRWIALPALTVAILAVAAPGQAAYPGVAGPIAYSKVETSAATYQGAGGIFVHGPRKGDAPRQLTDDPNDSNPSYSANGRLIVFSGNRDPIPPASPFGAPGSHIYVMNADGSDIRQLTSGDFYDSNPSFSPNGKVVVFDRAPVASHSPHIFSIGIDGGGLNQLTNDEGTDTEPTFTPNGKAIVFVSNRQSSSRTDRSNIFSMRPDGSGMRLLIGGPRSDYGPDVSPNGRSIAFVSNRARSQGRFPGRVTKIFIARMSGRHVRELPESRDGSSPSWAPDGKHIAFLESNSYGSDVQVMRADGRGNEKVFDGGGLEEEGYGTSVGAPGWGARPR